MRSISTSLPWLRSQTQSVMSNLGVRCELYNHFTFITTSRSAPDFLAQSSSHSLPQPLGYKFSDPLGEEFVLDWSLASLLALTTGDELDYQWSESTLKRKDGRIADSLPSPKAFYLYIFRRKRWGWPYFKKCHSWRPNRIAHFLSLEDEWNSLFSKAVYSVHWLACPDFTGLATMRTSLQCLLR